MMFNNITSVPLWEKMEILANANPESAYGLRLAATAFKSAHAGFFAEPQTVDVDKFMLVWVRARNLYCEVSGEPLI
jgi:hypothetical protein